MRLDRLNLRNYRQFESIEITFDPHLTVLAGINGAGKTSILQAASVALGTFLVGFDTLRGQGISQQDVHRICHELGEDVDVQEQYPVVVEAGGECGGRQVRWARVLTHRRGRLSLGQSRELLEMSRGYQRRLQAGDVSLCLPYLAYYGVGRSLGQPKGKTRVSLSPNSRLHGYQGSLEGTVNERLMTEWLMRMAIKRSQSEDYPIGYKVVARAMCRCFERITGHDDVEVALNADSLGLDMLYRTDDGSRQRESLSQLSDGYRSILGLVLDMAYRMAILNPQLKEQVLEETSGVVLIDEIEQHLHPAWQQRILGDLQAIFPQIQFIVTTHAPSVIHMVHSHNLRLFSELEVKEPVGEVYGKDTNLIISKVMGGKERPEAIKELFGQYYEALRQRNLAGAEERLNQLRLAIGVNDAELARCGSLLSLERFREGT